jgi:hypothetical protein
MYRRAGPTWKISKRTHAEIRKIHRILPMMLRFLWEKAMSMDPDKDMRALPAEPNWAGQNAARAALLQRRGMAAAGPTTRP